MNFLFALFADVLVVDGNTDWITSDGKLNPKDLIGQSLHHLGNLFRTKTPGVDPDSASVRDDPLRIKQLELIDNILSGKSKEEAIESRVPGAQRWFKTRYLPLIRRTRHGGIEGEAFIDGVVGTSVDITGEFSIIIPSVQHWVDVRLKNSETMKNI